MIGQALPTLMIAALCFCATGCTSGELTMDFVVVGETQSLIYRLDKALLTVRAGGGMEAPSRELRDLETSTSAEGETTRVIYQRRLTPQAVEHLKEVLGIAEAGEFPRELRLSDEV